MSAISYRLRVRNAADTADALTVTSVRSGTNPYISAPPTGDGQGFDPRAGKTEVGAYALRIADNGAAANVITGFLSDGSGRYDKLGRRAYLDYSTDGGSTWPNLLVAGYVTAISYPSAAEAQMTIGEAQRAERNRQAFAVASASFPATTMLGGGPVRWPANIVTPVNLPDRGPWTVALVAAGSTLRFVSGYVLKSADDADYSFVSDGALPEYTRARINTLTATEVPGPTAGSGGVFFHGNVYADLYTMAGTLIGTFHVTRAPVLAGITITVVNPTDFLIAGYFSVAWNSPDPVGTQYQCYLYTRSVSENSPLHLFAHPVAIVTGLLDDAAEPWDTTSAAAVTAGIGVDVRVFLRVTASEPTESFIAKLMGVFGFGRRMNSANVWEFFDSRTKSTGAPASVIADADLREIPNEVWSLDESTILNNVTITTERFALWAPGQSSTRPPDSLVPVEQKRTARYQLADGTFPETTQGIKELSYDLPGTILNAYTTEANLSDFTAAVAAPAFDRWGTGAPSTELACRDTVTAKVGDEVLLALAFLPNASARGGQRVVQVVQRTNAPGGPVLRVEDAGVTAQPAVAPTITVTASTRNAGQSADVTLTNAAALATAGVTAVVVEFAVSATTPTVAGQDLGTITPYAPLVLTTPATAGGSTVWARAKSVQAGKRAGAFTAWTSVALSGVSAPTSLVYTAAPADGSVGTLGWTAGTGSAAYAVRVYLRPSAFSITTDALVQSMQAGSIAAPLTGLTPGASYTATVQYVDATTGIMAAGASLTFTAGVTTITLSVPTDAHGIVGKTDALGVARTDGTYGLDVTAVELPGVVEFWQAIETGVATNLFGAPVLVASVPSVSGAVTSYRAVAPNDRLHRQLSARHVRTGANPSDYTYPVTLDAWGAVLGLPAVAELRDVTWAESDTTEAVAFGVSSSVAEVWGAYAVVPAPGSATDFDTLVAPFVAPIATGAGTFTVTRPGDGYVTLVQLEPRRADLTAGIVRRLTITATPQVPHVELDDLETATVGTQWWGITERGIAVATVDVQTQIGSNPISAFGAPTRGPGATSVVRGGILAAGQYEHDVTLDANRQSWITPRLTLVNGARPIVLGPFGFDRDKNPNLAGIPAVSGTLVTIIGDVDTKAVGLYSKTRAWKYELDGSFATIDVTKFGTNGSAGLAAGSADTFTAKALSDPVAYIGVGTLSDARDVVISNGAAAPAAAWDTVLATAPSFDGSTSIGITLKATAAPGSWTAQVWIADPASGTAVNQSAALSPALTAPPTTLTAYTFDVSVARAARTSGASFRSVELRADLLDNLGVVQDTRTVTISYWALLP